MIQSLPTTTVLLRWGCYSCCFYRSSVHSRPAVFPSSDLKEVFNQWILHDCGWAHKRRIPNRREFGLCLERRSERRFSAWIVCVLKSKEKVWRKVGDSLKKDGISVFLSKKSNINISPFFLISKKSINTIDLLCLWSTLLLIYLFSEK